MKRQTLTLAAVLCSLLLPSARLAADQPTIFGPVLNGASFDGFVPSDSTPTPIGTGLAGGSIFVIFGSKLGPIEIVLGSAPYPDQLPAEAGGTRVTFRSLEKNQVYTAPLIHAFQNQVSGIVPSPLPVGLAEVTVSYDGMESDPTRVAIVEYSPGLFTVSQTGRGPAVAQNYESTVEQPLNTLTHPASPGQYLILWGTGLGPIDGPDNVAPTAGNVRDDLAVWIGNVEVPAEYAGRSPEFPGVDQINVRIPDDGSVELGCYQDLGIQIGNHGFGAPTSVAISDKPGECDHPWGLPPQKLALLDSGGQVTSLTATLSADFSVAQASKRDAYGVSQNQSGGLGYAVILESPWFPGACLPLTVLSDYPGPVQPGPLRSALGQTQLSIGDSVEFAGPGARAVSLPLSESDPTAFGPVTDLGEDALATGEWTVSAAGGEDIAAFSSKFSIAGLPDLTLPTDVQIGGGMEIDWDGSPYEEGDQVLITLQQNLEEPPQSGLKSLRCRAPATLGSVVMTEQNLAWLGAEPGSPLLWEISIESAPQAIEAEGLDYGRLTALISTKIEATAIE